MAGKPTWLTAPLAVAVLFSSLAAAVFTWWVNREEPLRIAYSISTTATGPDAAGYSVVPDLAVTIGERSVPALYTHVITLLRSSGFRDSIDVAATFANGAEIFGRDAIAPSPVHRITCQPLQDGVRCQLGPVDGRGEYRLVLASDKKEQPEISTAGRDITLGNYQQVSQESPGETKLSMPVGLLVIAAVITFGVWLIFIRKSPTPTLDEVEKLAGQIQQKVQQLKLNKENRG